MIARTLTDLGVKNMRPGAVRREIPDRTPLLYLVLQPSGRRRFVLRYRYLGKSRKVTLAAGLSLADARVAAASAARDLERGVDPREARRTAKQQAALVAADTVFSICRAYQARDGAKLRTADARWRLLERHVFPVIGDRPIGSVRRGELVQLFDRVEDRSGARSADLVLAILSRIFRWHALRTETFNTPLVPGMTRHSIKEHARSRVLDDGELRRVWRASADAGTFGAFVRFLLLSGARRGEAGGLTWSEIDGGVWHLPATRSKTKQPLARPLSKAALATLDALPRVVDCRFVFSIGGGPATNFSRPKASLDAASGVTGWRLHDLRRTARSLMSRAGVNADHAERCLGHVIGGVRGTYDRHQFQAEMLHAFEALAAQVERIVDPPAGNVVPLHGAGT
jgi:integrase